MPKNFSSPKLYWIKEQAIVGHAEKIKKYTDGKVKFTAIIQTAEDENQNKRFYPLDVLTGGIDRISDTIKTRNLLGELDHPISDNPIRQTTVMYRECSHMITAVEFRGLSLFAEIETLPYTPNGKIMSGLVLDNVPVGFSLRGLADLEDNGTRQTVLAPLIMITYDCVSNPSHKQAAVQEVHQESYLRVVNENRQFVKCSNGICYLTNTFDWLVERKILKLHRDYWRTDWP